MILSAQIQQIVSTCVLWHLCCTVEVSPRAESNIRRNKNSALTILKGQFGALLAALRSL